MADVGHAGPELTLRISRSKLERALATHSKLSDVVVSDPREATAAVYQLLRIHGCDRVDAADWGFHVMANSRIDGEDYLVTLRAHVFSNPRTTQGRELAESFQGIVRRLEGIIASAS